MISINPKKYVLNTFKTGNGNRIEKVLNHYFKSVKYYKKQNPAKSENLTVDQVKELFDIQPKA
jgi:hypothetical protein